MCVCVCVCVSRSVMSNSVTPWTVTHQGPLSMEFSRQEYWSGLPFPSPGDLPDPGLEPRFLSSYIPASLVAQTVKRLPAKWETWVRSLGWEDLEKEMATHSSTLAWKIPWMEEPGRLQSMGLQRVEHDWATFTFTFLYCRQILYHLSHQGRPLTILLIPKPHCLPSTASHLTQEKIQTPHTS